MTRFLACCLALFAVLLVAAGVDARASRRDATAATQKAQQWQARYAEEVSKAQPVAETVRVRVASVRTIRDSLLVNLWDTVLVKEFVVRTDTLRVACIACATRLDSLRLTSDSTIHALRVQVEALQPSRWDRVKGPALFVGGLVLGAFVRGQK